MRIFLLLIFFVSVFFELNAQNNAYLAGKLYGEKAGDDFSNVNPLGDINGDGYADFSVGCGANYVKIYLGGAVFDSSRYVKFIGSTYDRAFAVYKLGDINNDGFSDFAISYSQPFHFCDLKLFLGKKVIDTIPDFSLIDNFGAAAALGDVNGDGFNDFMAWSVYLPITAAKGETAKVGGVAKLFLGGKSFDPLRYINFAVNYNRFLGCCVTPLGDLNNDGFSDFIIGYPEFIQLSYPGIDPNQAHIHYGRPVISTIPDVILNSGNDTNFGKFINYAGKLDNSSKNNFIISSDKNIYIYSDTNKIMKLPGWTFAGGGDFNGDGYDDFAISIPSYLNSDSVMTGAAWLYYGGATIDTVPKLTLTGKYKWEEFGYSCTFLGDINKDGSDELAITSPNENNSAGKITIYSGKEISYVRNYINNNPSDFYLEQNFPNPFNPATTINYSVPVNSRIKIIIYNTLGQVVKVLVDEIKQAGNYNQVYNANNLPSGVYFYSLNAQSIDGVLKNSTSVKKMVLMK